MPRWLEILLTLVLFSAGMSVVGWALNASVPSVHAWLIGSIGRSGAWALLIAFWLVAGFYAWRGHRKAGSLDGR